MKRLLSAIAVSLALSIVLALPAAAEPISILAAENFYGEAASAIGGDRVAVESVIVAAGTDPHDFEPPASVARATAEADIVIMNGADYDHWMEHLIEASSSDGRIVIDVASLIGVEEGENPHIWYDPKAMPALANALTDALIAVDPDGKAGYEARRDAFLARLAPIDATVADLRARFAGTAVVATEPVFGHMADAIGLTMQNEAFQTAIMNEIEPAASDIAAVEDDIRGGKVRVLFYNSQVEDAFTRNLADLARASGVPIVGVSETQPAGKTFAEWMIDTLDATARALDDQSS
jgi:zinc/manganese transport system substrate-binding protein